MADNRNWDQEDLWWKENFNSRPYAAGYTYEEFRPAYRYGFESGRHSLGRTWHEVEADLRTGWDKYQFRPERGSTWDKVKDAVMDAWHRVTGQQDLDVEKMSESSEKVRTTRNA